MTKINPNLLISIDCYRDQFRAQLQKKEPRLLKYLRSSHIIFYYYSGACESVAVDNFIESNSSLLSE